MSRVCLLKCENYDLAAVRACVDRIFEEMGGIGKYIKAGTRVLIKPNLIARRKPELAITTHPVFVEAVACACREQGAVVTIADSPGGVYNKSILKKVYEVSGMEAAAKAAGAKLNFDTSDRAVLLCGEIDHLRMNLITPVFENDVVINCAKLKTHTMTYLSGCVKNLFGTVSGVFKTQFHYQFEEKEAFCNMLVDLCEYVRPTISFLDAVDAMEGNGPSNGKKKHLGLILGGENPYAVDAVASDLIGLDETQVFTLVNARRRGLVQRSPAEIEVVGESVDAVRPSSFEKPDTYRIDFRSNVPDFLANTLQRIVRPAVPKFNRSRCVACRACIKACPAGALVMEGKLPKVDAQKCIKCYCCQEMCPKDAILLKSRYIEWINRLRIKI